MPVVCQQVELMVRVNQRRASLPDVLAEVARWGCNVLAYCSYADREEFVVLLVADDPAVAKRGLEGRGFKIGRAHV